MTCQHPENGTFLPNALSCENKLSDYECEHIFPCDPYSYPSCNISLGLEVNPESRFPIDAPYVRSQACLVKEALPFAMQCARTCAMCFTRFGYVPCNMTCQHPENGTFLPNALSCENKLSDYECEHIFPCDPYSYPSCNISLGLEVNPESKFPIDAPYVRSQACLVKEALPFAMQCARTCAMCCLTAEHGCQDNPDSPIDCKEYTDKCDYDDWQYMMVKNCPATCGFCNRDIRKIEEFYPVIENDYKKMKLLLIISLTVYVAFTILRRMRASPGSAYHVIRRKLSPLAS
uniref:ShKT domain-containing protein n=1 Tax=Panagrolaimus sp. JU765 TaxID=591449 RepID=A0AC34QDA5_9BILA